MARRLHTPNLRPGDNPLDRAQARHARNVLRLEDGADVEMFDDAGRTARGVLVLHGDGASVLVEQVDSAGDEGEQAGLTWIVAAAVPKGERADWMVEKLSELGTAAFVPLAAARSVSLPEGRGKRDRWVRLATESAKQSRRRGVMRIDDLTPLPQAVDRVPRTELSAAWYFSTAPGAVPVSDAVKRLPAAALTLFVGPEGGWTEEEMAAFDAAGFLAVRLTDTVLRVETAAVAGAAVLGAFAMGRMIQPSSVSFPHPEGTPVRSIAPEEDS